MPRRRSVRSLPNSSSGSPVYWNILKLGDNLHELAALSPIHVEAVALLVAEMLHRLRPKKKKKTAKTIPSLANEA